MAAAAWDLAAAVAAAQDLAAAQGLDPAVAACMCVAEGAGKATLRGRARRRPRSGAGVQFETYRCLVCGL